MTKRLTVLDFWRGLAIFCVIIDHLFAWINIPDQYQIYHQYFIFSVAPLFFLAGVTFALSWSKKPLSLQAKSSRQKLKTTTSYYWHKVHSLILSYLVVVLITMLWNYQPLTLKSYLDTLLAFPHQFYFILIYLQLLAIAPILAHYIKKFCHFSSKKHSNTAFWLFSLAILIFSLICNHLPVFDPKIYLPGRLLFGGIELFIFYCGQVTGFFGLKCLQPDENWRPFYCLMGFFG
ncbi:OpgC domain-containing protein, partial [bacterium]|nr:OpgC domain-containing protein [bacterium]